jgi:mannuronan synthase
MDAPHGDYAFSKHLNAWLTDLRRPAPRGLAKWTPGFVASYLTLWTVIITIAVLMPNRFLSPEVRDITITLGILGTWRFGWWFTHAMRAEYYRRLKDGVHAGCISR